MVRLFAAILLVLSVAAAPALAADDFFCDAKGTLNNARGEVGPKNDPASRKACVCKKRCKVQYCTEWEVKDIPTSDFSNVRCDGPISDPEFRLGEFAIRAPWITAGASERPVEGCTMNFVEPIIKIPAGTWGLCRNSLITRPAETRYVISELTASKWTTLI